MHIYNYEREHLAIEEHHLTHPDPAQVAALEKVGLVIFFSVWLVFNVALTALVLICRDDFFVVTVGGYTIGWIWGAWAIGVWSCRRG